MNSAFFSSLFFGNYAYCLINVVLNCPRGELFLEVRLIQY